MSEDNFNSGLTFPDPVLGTVKRPPGQGCNSCVHQAACRPLYWVRRKACLPLDNYAGCACASWSNNIADRITTINAVDLALNAYLNDICVLEEPNEGFDDAVTADANEW